MSLFVVRPALGCIRPEIPPAKRNDSSVSLELPLEVDLQTLQYDPPCYISLNGCFRGSFAKVAWQMQQNIRTLTPVCGLQNGVSSVAVG